MIIGLGLFTEPDCTSSIGTWVGFQIVEAVRAGLVLGTLLPAVQAELSEIYTATATGAFAFIRSFGIFWRSSIPAAVFITQSGKLSYLSGFTDQLPSLRTCDQTHQSFFPRQAAWRGHWYLFG